MKLDDLGLHLCQRDSRLAKRFGGMILNAAPYMMKGLSVVGTAAMFMVGGAILTHGIPVLHHAIEQLAHVGGGASATGIVLQALVPTLLNAAFGIVAGGVVVAGVALFGKVRGKLGLAG
ncbi:Inner membrane protein YedI [compost metagenome]